MHKYINKPLNTQIRGYAPGLALQVSGVSDFFRSMLSSFFGLRFPCLRLLDRLSNQLVDGFVRGVYMYEKECHALIKMTHGNQDAMQRD